MPKILGREPVLWLGLVQAIIVVVTAFGLDLTTEQVGAIILLTTAILSFVARQIVVAPIASDGTRRDYFPS